MSSPENQPPDKSFEAKLVDAVTKAVVYGGGGYGLYNLYLKDVPAAAISFIISLGASFIDSFGRPIIKKWKSGLKQLGEQVGETSSQEMGKTAQLMANRNFDQQYLEALKVQCDRIELEGFQNLQPLALDKVYVPVQIQTRDQLDLSGQKTIWDFLPKRYQSPSQSTHRRIAILADPGYGKTTLMRHLTRTYAIDPPEDTPQFIPVLLRLREIYGLLRIPGPEQTAKSLSLSELIVQHIPQQRGCKNLKPSKYWFDRALKNGKCLVLFDGLDEVPKGRRQAVRRWVDTQMQDYGNTQFILTSRPHGFDLRPDEPSHPIEIDTRLEVLKFNNPQKETFINNWYRALYEREWGSNQQEREQQLDAEQVSATIEDDVETSAADLKKQLFADIQLTAIASNPLLLTLIANTHRVDTFLPKRRVELYERICNLCLGTRPYVKGTNLSLTATENKSLLQLLAWELVTRETTQFTLTEAIPWIEEKLDRYSKVIEPGQFWEEIRDISGLLVEKELGLYEFSHQTFQEYLAACHIKELGQPGDQILFENLNNVRWQEVVCFYAAQRDATGLVKLILDAYDNSSSKEPNIYLLELADRCRIQGRELSAETRQRLDDVLIRIPRKAAKDLSTSMPLRSTEELPPLIDTPHVKLVELAAGNDRFLNDLDQREKFRQVIQLDENIAIRQSFVSCREFYSFLQDVSNDQFHATVELSGRKPSIADDTLHLPITWDEAQWFCGWLSTHAEITSNEGIYHYRLPTEDEWRKILEGALLAPPSLKGSRGELQPFIQSANSSGNALCIVREQVPPRYVNLINYLANAQWQEADQETGKVMLEVANRQSQGYLELDDIKNFPCKDLRLIDQLWLKFSGGHFGFSVQKEIYLSCGGKADYQYDQEAYEKFGERVGWREDNSWEYGMRYDLSQSPGGHLPVCFEDGMVVDFGLCPSVCWVFSRIQACKL